MKFKLLQSGGMSNFADFSKVKFPVKVNGTKRKNVMGQICGCYVTRQEIEHIGGVIISEDAIANAHFYFSIALGEVAE